MVPIELVGLPDVVVSRRAGIEVVLPISPADEAWRSAFGDALATYPQGSRISVEREAIRIVAYDQQELDDSVGAVLTALDAANARSRS